MNLNKRQSIILDYINKRITLRRLEIEEFLASGDYKRAKNTVLRDLKVLLKNKCITKTGFGRGVLYHPANFKYTDEV